MNILMVNIESFHRRLEQRPELTQVELALNERSQSIYLPTHGNLSDDDKSYILQQASSLRWIEGPGEITIKGHDGAHDFLKSQYLTEGSLSFEHELFSSLIDSPSPEDIESGEGACNLFIDIGGSSLKGVLFSNGQLSRQLSVAWQPFCFAEMHELITHLESFLDELSAERTPSSVSHIGISCAGLCRDGALLASTLTQGMNFSDESPYDPWFLKRMIQRIFSKSSFRLLNDGAVTALPHRDQAPFGKRRVISLVMGSNLGGGYYSEEEPGGIHELGFIPFLLGSGIKDEWSGYEGIASEVFSKKGLLWIAQQHGYVLGGRTERVLIDQLHTDLRHGLTKARIIFQKLGEFLAPFVTYLQRFYEIDEVLLSGGILTAAVVDEMREAYHSSYTDLTGTSAPALRMLVVPGVLPEYNQAWSLALNYFATNQE